jgi:Family of unknown function (DUF6807)
MTGAAPKVAVTVDESAQTATVTVDGQPFTSYIHPASAKKPVLYPIRAANGAFVTRGWPLAPRPGERIDHPHHIGLWFNHGDVNGFDFWNNSEAITGERRTHMGTIVHRRIVNATSGDGEGTLAVEAEWRRPDGRPLLREATTFVFHATADARTIDRETTLTALDEKVTFTDNKEGVLGLRVARGLEQPADKPEVYTDAAGQETKTPVLDNTGVDGHYTSSEGLQGDAVWGTRGRWTMLTGMPEGKPVTLAILDAPSNPGYPTYWHARGYGLFAANPLGARVFTEGKQSLDASIAAGASLSFRYRILILDGKATAADIESAWKAFATGSH